MDKRIARWTARFVSPDTEKAFRHAIFKGNFGNNVAALSLAVPVFALYGFHDAAMLDDPTGAIRYRLAVCGVCGLMLLTLRLPPIARFHETVCSAIVIMLSTALFFIIALQVNLDHTYYVGLIQGGVFVCFLLRVGFLSALFVLSVFLIGFILAVQGKPQTNEAFVQVVILLTMFSICGFGNYLLQRYRRMDFLKTITIEEQNAQLIELLEDAKQDNRRKVAALNMLVHVVKTPLHQINGFSDIVMQSLKADNRQDMAEVSMDSARYIKDATANLAQSINNLLAYHRLDEVENENIESVSLKHAIDDFRDLIISEIKVSINGSVNELKTHESAIRTTIQCLADFYNSSSQEIEELAVELEQEGDVAKISLRDDGAKMSPEQFEKETKPLTKIEKYLTGEGSDMTMKLRTVARAAEVCGGAFEREEIADGNKFSLKLKSAV